MFRDRLPELALLSVVAIFASTFVLAKQIFAEIAPLAFAGVRFFLIAALAVAVLAVSGASWRVCRGDVVRFVAVGVCGYTFYQLGFVLGLERTSPFSSALLISTVPLFTIVLLTVLGERPRVQAWIGVIVSLAGIAVFEVDKLGAPGSLVGDLLSVGSAVSFAVYGVLNRPLVKRYATPTYTAYTVLAGALPLVLVSAPAMAAQDWRGIAVGTWLSVAYMVVVPVYLAYQVWNWAIGQRGAAAASSYVLLVPVVSGAFSVALFGEAFGPTKLVGAVLVLLGLVVLQRR